MASQPKVYLVDDDEAVRDSLSLSLKRKGWNIEAYPTADAFLEHYNPEQPGCLVLDVRMPGTSGPELQEMLAAKNCKIPIIFMTGHGDIPLSVRTIKAGAIDFLEKPFKRDVLLERIEEAVALDAQIRDQAAWERVVMDRYERLTPRERQVMGLVVQGLSNKEVARELESSHRTVDVHRARVMEKMNVTSLSALVAIAVKCGVHRAPGAPEPTDTIRPI